MGLSRVLAADNKWDMVCGQRREDAPPQARPRRTGCGRRAYPRTRPGCWGMTRPQPLPDGLPQRFHVAEALGEGVSRTRLRASDLAALYHGVRSRSLGEANTVLERCRAYTPRLAPGQFFSHETVFFLRGLSTPEWPYTPGIHVSAHRPAREPRTHGVVGHRLQTREPAVEAGPEGMPMENAVRAWRQCGRLWSLDDLVAGADALLGGRRPIASIGDLEAEVTRMGDVRRGILRRSLALARPGVRSPRETRLRLLLTRQGSPNRSSTQTSSRLEGSSSPRSTSPSRCGVSPSNTTGGSMPRTRASSHGTPTAGQPSVTPAGTTSAS